jgi:predicted Zn-dependent protease
MIDEGIVAWTSRIDLVMKLVRVPDEANIIMRWHNFDGPGGTLADAHVGGRNVNQRLELRFDETESWTESKFITTARHELGHIIGLTHSGALPGDLMNPFLNEGIVDPSDNDIARAAKIWD